MFNCCKSSNGPADAVAMYHNVYKKRKMHFFANELFVCLLGAFDDMMSWLFGIKKKQIHTATKKTIERMRTFFSGKNWNIVSIWKIIEIYYLWLEERPWQKTPINIVERNDCLLIPAYIQGRNSWFLFCFSDK